MNVGMDGGAFWMDGVVPDVLAAQPNDSATMKVEYKCGDLVGYPTYTPTDTKDAPTVTINGAEGKFYTLVCTDPDAPSRENPLYREFIHWVVADIPSGGTASDGEEKMSYVGPAPPCNSGDHRYVFLALEQPAKGGVSIEAWGAGRGGKKAAALIEANKLTVACGQSFQSSWDESCDQAHEALGFVPPPEYQSEKQKAANAAYGPKSVQDAWDNHFGAFGGQDVDKILLDYTEDSLIRVFNYEDGSKAEFKGVEAAKNLFTSLFKDLHDLATLDAPVVDVEEDIGNGCGQVFLVWKCPGSGYNRVTDTFFFDSNFKIIRQNIVRS